nr:MAG TPA: hypothetical protein [Caudoviricetes sp.]
MTRREQCNFILHILIPAIEEEGLTIKTHRDGELTLSASGSITANFIQNLRQHCIDEIQRKSVPASPYGVL